MVMPLWHHDPFEWPKPPYVMWALIIINFGVFFFVAVAAPDETEQLAKRACDLLHRAPLLAQSRLLPVIQPFCFGLEPGINLVFRSKLLRDYLD